MERRLPPLSIAADLLATDPDDLRMVQTRFASETRRPCRRGEYIVIALTPPGGLMNTMIVVGAANADNAMAYRASRCRDDTREGRYLVTNGKASAVYEVSCGGAKIDRVLDNFLGDREDW